MVQLQATYLECSIQIPDVFPSLVHKPWCDVDSINRVQHFSRKEDQDTNTKLPLFVTCFMIAFILQKLTLTVYFQLPSISARERIGTLDTLAFQMIHDAVQALNDFTRNECRRIYLQHELFLNNFILLDPFTIEYKCIIQSALKVVISVIVARKLLHRPLLHLQVIAKRI